MIQRIEPKADDTPSCQGDNTNGAGLSSSERLGD